LCVRKSGWRQARPSNQIASIWKAAATQPSGVEHEAAMATTTSQHALHHTKPAASCKQMMTGGGGGGGATIPFNQHHHHHHDSSSGLLEPHDDWYNSQCNNSELYN